MAATRLRRPAHRTSPCRLDIADLHAPVINAFLDQIERKRGNTIRSCNARLAAILPVHLRSPAPPRARRRHRPGTGHPAQAGRSDNRHVPHQHRDRGPARRPGPDHPHRPPRPRLDPARSPDRAAALRAHRPDPLGCPPRHRPLRRLPRQGRKDRITPLAPGTVTTLRARRTRRDTRRPAVHHHPRRAHVQRRPAAAPGRLRG
jgi:hypothetical protein